MSTDAYASQDYLIHSHLGENMCTTGSSFNPTKYLAFILNYTYSFSLP